jgi:hypothetical protein
MVVSYYADMPAYAVNCVNKGQPQMHCNGKCQLQKKLNEGDNKDNGETGHRNGIQIAVLSSKTFFATIISPVTKILKRKYHEINFGHTVDKSLCFFHPPQDLFSEIIFITGV